MQNFRMVWVNGRQLHVFENGEVKEPKAEKHIVDMDDVNDRYHSVTPEAAIIARQAARSKYVGDPSFGSWK